MTVFSELTGFKVLCRVLYNIIAFFNVTRNRIRHDYYLHFIEDKLGQTDVKWLVEIHTAG